MSTDNPETLAALAALIARHNLTETKAAGLLGVPVHTLAHWLAGRRSPGAAAVRLIEILCMLDAMAPALLAALIPTTGYNKRPKKNVHVGKVPQDPSPT